jgi:diadenosine tetraphosphatase ApaH/serine/threonine PP2A family protein phosphatase
MRLIILSDIHGNLEALEAVLADAGRFQASPAGPASLVCLGDLVGYGANPEEVVRTVRAAGALAVRGNHEMGLAGRAMRGRFNPQAWAAVRWTASKLSRASLDWLKELPTSLVLEGCRFVHGLPPDDVDTYVTWASLESIRQAMTGLPEEICFVGHTHLLGVVSFAGDEIVRSRLAEGARVLAAGSLHLVNAGSVGQPRDGDPRAKYCLFDPASRELTVRFVPYDAKSAAQKILDSGQPAVFAERLLREG